MTQQLEKAFKEASKLSEREQNIIAKWFLEEIHSDDKWNTLYAESEEILEILAKDAVKDFESGKTEKLDINKL